MCTMQAINVGHTFYGTHVIDIVTRDYYQQFVDRTTLFNLIQKKFRLSTW